MATIIAATAGGTTTVRVSQATHKKLRDVAGQLGVSLTAAMEQAVECYRRKVFFDIADAQYAALQADPLAWQEYVREQEEWDVTLMDGLENDPWPADA